MVLSGKLPSIPPGYLVSHTHARVMVNYVYALTQKILTKTLCALTTKFPQLQKLHGSTVDSKLDAKNCYWSITLDKESQLLTTFNTPFARYCFIRMPFGLVMSQDMFQQRMDIILEQCPGTIGIADDLVVYGHNESEHDANLHCLMQVAVKEGLVFNSKKTTAAPPRLQRMLLRLQQYDVTIKYVPGKDLTIPDALSRLPSTNTHHIKLDLSVNILFSFLLTDLLNLKLQHTMIQPCVHYATPSIRGGLISDRM